MQSLAKLAVGKDSYKLKVVLLEMDGFHWCRTHLHVRKACAIFVEGATCFWGLKGNLEENPWVRILS